MRLIMYSFFVLSALILSACGGNNRAGGKSGNVDCMCCDEESVLDMLLNVPEVKALSQKIETESGGKHGMTTLVDLSDEDAQYRINVGFNHQDTFNTVYTFIVDKKTCEVKVEHPLSAKAYSLNEWQERNKKYERGEMAAFD